jgi:ribose 5-phosphate isomerase B
MVAKIGIAADHAGKELKHFLQEFLNVANFEVIDYGVAHTSDKSVDYPDYAALLANDIRQNKIERGILVCGTGIGMAIVANKFPGVRAAQVWDEFTAKMSRLHNNANVLCLGARVLNYHRAADLAKLWLETEYEGGRHQPRIDKVRTIEKRNFVNS